jgi:hypothetical protein
VTAPAVPNAELFFANLAQCVTDVRDHQHPERGEDLYCLNLTSFMGERMGAVLKHRTDERAALTAAVAWAAEEYRKCIVSARATHDSHHYAKCNGRAEAYRQLCTEVATAAGLDVPDWEAIKVAVPPDGIYR